MSTPITPTKGYFQAKRRVPLRLGQLARVGAAAAEDGRAATGRELHGLVDRPAGCDPVREPGREAVAAAVGVLDLAGERRGRERAAGLGPPAEGAGRRDDDLRRRVEVAGAVALALVLPASDEHVDLDSRARQRRELARRRDQGAGAPRVTQRLDVAADEVGRVRARQLVPRQRAVAAGRERLVAEDGDRALAV